MRARLARLLAPLRARLPERAVAFDASVLFSGFSLQLITQIGWLVLALRFLGPEGYGLFASLTAVSMAVSCFVGWGCDQLLIRHVSAARSELSRWMGHSLLAITVTALPLLAGLMLLLPWVQIGQIGTTALLAVLVADLLLSRYANLCIAVYMATGQSARQSTVTVLIGATRLAAIALAGMLPGALTLDLWALWYAGATALAAVLCLGMTFRDHGAPHWGWPWQVWIGGQLGEGLAFSAESALQASVKDLDKPIVLEFAGAHAAGLYAAAFRIIDTLALPIRALGYAIYARLFRLAAEDREACIAYGLKFLPVALGIGLAAALGVLVAADLLPVIFGAAYAELPWLVRLTCLMPAAFGAYIVGADVLSAIGRQSHRLAVVAVSVALTLGLCWLLVPWAGIAGAAVARVGVMALTAGLVWALVLKRPSV